MIRIIKSSHFRKLDQLFKKKQSMYLQALITAYHISVVMQIVTNATSNGVVLGFTFRCCLSFLTTSFLFVSTTIRQMAKIKLNE